ncbi:protein kinase [Lentinula detonsa]|uniref:Protein kinase n=1 Tax=Lentinula detonsa TaxID=2804962 RepID=A0A9W8NV89_9AGAR|nr:protein kinase [Lentinula detonsa]
MEPIPENHPSNMPQTPGKKMTDGPEVVQSTPQSRNCCTHAQDEVPQNADVLNKFLDEDIQDKVVFTLDEFATIILGLPPKCDVEEEFSLEPESEAVKDAFEAYLRVAIGVSEVEGQKRTGAATHEKKLYQPLANLLNILRNGTDCAGKEIDEKIFFVQDPRPVLGSLLERKPDLGAIYTQLLKLTENQQLSKYLAKKKIVGVFWGLLLFFVEVKHRKGNFIGLNARKQGTLALFPFEYDFNVKAVLALRARSLSRVPSSSRAQSKKASSTHAAEERPRVTIYQSGGKEKTVEVGTSQFYAQKAEEELKAEENMTPTQGQHHTRIQCASYAKEMLSNGFIRNHAMGIVADDNGVRFHYYDRSKVIESQASLFLLHDEWKKLFMAMVCQLNKLDHEKLGFIPHLDLLDFDHLRDPKQFAYDLGKDLQGLVGARYSFIGSDGLRRVVVIEKVLYRAEGIIGRCSIVVEVRCICSVSGCNWDGENKIMKISFPTRGRTSEEVFIREARAKAKSSGNHWALNHLPNIIDSITVTYDETKTVQGRLKAHLKEKYEERVMRVTILEKLHSLSELEDVTEFAQVFYDILQIHRWLYECAGILHRDLSIGNIMFRRIDGKVYGVLNDFDLSSFVHDMGKGPASDFRTGTRPFMSVDLLDPKWKGGHLYRHDLESLFFIMICLTCRYERPGVPAAEPRPFSKWFSGTDDEVRENKADFYRDRYSGELPIQHYFAGFTDWMEAIYFWLCTAYQGRPRVMHPPTPKLLSAWAQNPQSQNNFSNTSYDWNTLGGIFAYANMKQTMSSFQDQPLETRWLGGNPDH